MKYKIRTELSKDSVIKKISELLLEKKQAGRKHIR